MSPDKVHELNARTNQWIRRLAVIVAALFLALNAITAAGIAWVAIDARNKAKTNGQVLAVVLAVTGCTVKDTPDQCRGRIRESSLKEGARRIAEVDCADRRRDAGLPAPIPPDSCISQTPPEVYPGQPAE